jgi:hypothetical protein
MRVVQTQTDIALCEIDRSYRKSLGNLDFGIQSKVFRADDQNLRNWLLPPPPAIREVTPAPTLSFNKVCGENARLVLADRALERADEIAEHRWLFVSKAANLLARLSRGDDLGSMRDWTHLHGVPFAANGKVKYSFRLPNQRMWKTIEWHLKEGDHTTPESAARIYFCREAVGGIDHIIVFYVGPHPPSGTYDSSLSDIGWDA